MAKIQLQTNLMLIKSGNEPSEAQLPEGNMAFGVVGGEPKLYGNDGDGVKDYIGEAIQPLKTEMLYSVIQSEVTNNPQYLPDTGDGFINEIEIYGKSTQDGTPTPENPVPIQSVPSSFNIITRTRNIITEEFLYSNGFRLVEDNKWYRPAGYAVTVDGLSYPNLSDVFFWENAVGYTGQLTFQLTAKYNSGVPVGAILRAFYTDGTNSFLGDGMPTNGTYNTRVLYTTLGKTVSYIKGAFGSGSSPCWWDMDGTQLEIGSQATPVVKGQKEVKAIELKDTSGNPIELNGLGGVSDYIDLTSGKAVIRLKKWQATSGTGWTYAYHAGQEADYCKFTNPDLKQRTYLDAFCSIVRNLPLAFSVNTMTIAGRQIQLYLSTSTLPSRNDAGVRAFIEEEKPVFLYELETPYTIDLHPDTISSLKSIRTFDSGTYLYTEITVNPEIWTREFHDSEIGKQVLLKNKDGETLNPVTQAEAVLFRDGNDLEEKIKELQPKESWEDITDLFTLPPPFETGVVAFATTNFEPNDIIRVTVETGYLAPDFTFYNYGNMRFELNVPSDNMSSVNPQIKSIHVLATSTEQIASQIYADNIAGTIRINYHYGIDIDEYPEKPKIFKIERLINE